MDKPIAPFTMSSLCEEGAGVGYTAAIGKPIIFARILTHAPGTPIHANLRMP